LSAESQCFLPDSIRTDSSFPSPVKYGSKLPTITVEIGHSRCGGAVEQSDVSTWVDVSWVVDNDALANSSRFLQLEGTMEYQAVNGVVSIDNLTVANLPLGLANGSTSVPGGVIYLKVLPSERSAASFDLSTGKRELVLKLGVATAPNGDM
jgi:hypothetical protein